MSARLIRVKIRSYVKCCFNISPCKYYLKINAAEGTPIRITVMGDLHFGLWLATFLRALFNKRQGVRYGGHVWRSDHARPRRGGPRARRVAQLRRTAVVAVLGNHDDEANNQEEIMDILEEAGSAHARARRLRHGDRAIGFAGTKGFCGGFLNCRIAPFGERILRCSSTRPTRSEPRIYRELKIAEADFRIVSTTTPRCDTCIGEHTEVIPFLGRLSFRSGDTFKADLVLHGHAHNGREKGKNLAGIPVRNVARPHNKKYALYDTEMFPTPVTICIQEKAPSAFSGSLAAYPGPVSCRRTPDERSGTGTMCSRSDWTYSKKDRARSSSTTLSTFSRSKRLVGAG